MHINRVNFGGIYLDYYYYLSNTSIDFMICFPKLLSQTDPSIHFPQITHFRSLGMMVTLFLCYLKVSKLDTLNYYTH